MITRKLATGAMGVVLSAWMLFVFQNCGKSDVISESLVIDFNADSADGETAPIDTESTDPVLPDGELSRSVSSSFKTESHGGGGHDHGQGNHKKKKKDKGGGGDTPPTMPAEVPAGIPTFQGIFPNATSTTDITIERGQSVRLSGSIEIGLLVVKGELYCDPGANIVLVTRGMIVEDGGFFQCGSPEVPFDGSLRVRLKAGTDIMGMGDRLIGAMSGGAIRLTGLSSKSRWQRISATINPGDLEIHLPQVEGGWKAGDSVVVASTSFNFKEAEERVVTLVSGTTVRVDRPFQYKHFGEEQIFTQGERRWTLNERAEVANLSRNIRIEPLGDVVALDEAKIGGHIMIMGGGFAYFDSVELDRMGQMGKMARYPFHWHQAGNVDGQYIRNSSITNSYQRCVTIHGTHYARVENNVCYNHFGHGFFLENGGEQNNTIIGNLAILSKKVPAGRQLLFSDTFSRSPTRFPAPSSFWISNPNNTVVDNVVAGSEGSGFWMSFSQRLSCNEDLTDCDFDDSRTGSGGKSLSPARMATKSFSNNTAHSAMVGITWDGAADGPKTNNPRNSSDRETIASHYYYNSDSSGRGTVPVFDNLVVFKTIGSGLYFRGNTSTYRNLIVADNTASMFFAFNQVVEDSLVVGISKNSSPSDFTYLKSRGFARHLHGIRLYDGPWDLRRVHFANFPAERIIVERIDYTPVPFLAIGGSGRYLNSVIGVTFNPKPVQMYALDSETGVTSNWADHIVSSAIRDLDGSLTGSAGKMVVPVHPMNQDPSCTLIAGERALNCGYRFGILNFNHTTSETVASVERSDGAKIAYTKGQLAGKIVMIEGKGYSYRANLTPVMKSQPTIRMTYDADGRNISPVVEIIGFSDRCDLSGFQRASSLNDLKRLDSIRGGVAVFDDRNRSGSVFMRFYPDQQNPRNLSQYAPKGAVLLKTFSCR